MQRLELEVDLGAGELGQRWRRNHRRGRDRARDRRGGSVDGRNGYR